MVPTGAIYFRVVLVGFIVHFVAGSCSDTSLGMESGKIPDNKISASSIESADTPAKNGRLRYTMGHSWCASTLNSNQYLQIDLGTNYIICAVATQGNSKANQMVKTYQLQTSTDGTTWTMYEEKGQAKVFAANSDRNTVVKHVLLKGIVAKLIRFQSKSHSSLACLRAEVFGIKQSQEDLAFTKTATQSSTATSKPAALAVNGNPEQCSTTKANTNPWWEVDIGQHAVVSEVNIVSHASSEEFKVIVGEKPLCEGRLNIPDGGPLSIVCNNKPTQRLISISVPGTNKILTLCEVKVFLDVKAESVNLALNKPTNQSSTRTNGGAASRAVDGNRNSDFDEGNSCTHTKGGEDNPWWRVDLLEIQLVSSVYVVNRKGQYGTSLAEFELRIGNAEGDDADTRNPKCGDMYSIHPGETLKIYCDPPMYGRYVYIRIPGSDKTLAMCEVEVYSASNACTNQAVGVFDSVSYPDHRWTAPSSKNGNEPYKARLDGTGAWAPVTNSGADYLQIDLGAVYVICAVVTQGNPKKVEWTKTYKIKMSVNKDDWSNYKEGNSEKVLTGNADRNSIVKYNLVGLNQARFVRFVPVKYYGGKALRVEIYGYRQGVLASPTDVRVTNVQSRSLTVKWTNPDDDPALEFARSNEIHYSSGNTTLKIITEFLTTSQNLTGLTPYTEYKVKVLVVNNVGQGLWSAEKSFRTDSDVPGKAPTLTSTPKDSKGIVMSSAVLGVVVGISLVVLVGLAIAFACVALKLKRSRTINENAKPTVVESDYEDMLQMTSSRLRVAK